VIVKRAISSEALQKPRERAADDEPEVSIVPEGEPSASLVRALLAKSGHTVTSAAKALGLSRRTLERFVTDGPGWQRPRPMILAALNVLSATARHEPEAHGQPMPLERLAAQRLPLLDAR
jgi:hypothetical protein